MSKKEQEKTIVKPVWEDGYYGLGVESGRLNVVVHKRKRYVEDAQIPKKVDGVTQYDFVKAGDYGPWVQAPRPFHPNTQSALKWVHELMVQDGLEEASTVLDALRDLEKVQALIEAHKCTDLSTQ
jgi:hypothetical protein